MITVKEKPKILKQIGHPMYAESEEMSFHIRHQSYDTNPMADHHFYTQDHTVKKKKQLKLAVKQVSVKKDRPITVKKPQRKSGTEACVNTFDNRRPNTSQPRPSSIKKPKSTSLVKQNLSPKVIKPSVVKLVKQSSSIKLVKTHRKALSLNTNL